MIAEYAAYVLRLDEHHLCLIELPVLSSLIYVTNSFDHLRYWGIET